MALARDKEGYLKNLEDWSLQVARALAEEEGVAFTDDVESLVHLVREFYGRTEIAPAMRPLVKLVKTELGAELGNSIALMQIFPDSPAKQLAKIAGLPRPTNCL